MSFLTFVVALLAMLVAAISGAVTCPCNDSPPTNGNGEIDYTCEEQALFGQCGATWMEGYCQCACSVCEYEETTDEVVPVETVPEETDTGSTEEVAVEAPAPELTKEEKRAAKAARKAEKEAKRAEKEAKKAEKEARRAAKEEAAAAETDQN
eukprot:TRINITY_DN272_c1_g1_i1.p3 TRINITY_DN272_c1_g1~~TRINITY_DN272_c1_g1_i1.p3  ORF type:complete len:152 (-),score=56.25 TRINITY_DN272_c1_g1_i1:290-745(-)